MIVFFAMAFTDVYGGWAEAARLGDESLSYFGADTEPV